MKIENTFTVPRPLAQTWHILLDIPTVVPCIPGVTLKEMVSEREFRLLGSVKLGPVQLSMEGDAQVASADEATRVAVLRGKGRDNKGRGTASADMTLALTAENPTLTTVRVTTELELAGAIAQYGRGVGLIQAVAGQIIQQFAANLQARLGPASPIETSTAPLPPPAPAARPLSLFQLLWQTLKAAFARR